MAERHTWWHPRDLFDAAALRLQVSAARQPRGLEVADRDPRVGWIDVLSTHLGQVGCGSEILGLPLGFEATPPRHTVVRWAELHTPTVTAGSDPLRLGAFRQPG
jgi:hypothetical protein